MKSSPSPASGFMGALRNLGDDLLAGIQDRAELLGIELQEEKFRLIQTFIWISAIVFTGMLTALFASITLVLYFWQSAPLAVLGGLTLFYGLCLAGAILRLRYYLAQHPQPFAATLAELGADRACIHNPN